MKIWLDGNFIDESEAKISAFSKSTLWGRSLYEKVRIYQGWPFRLPDHISRLERSAKALGIKLPKSFQLLADGVFLLISKSQLQDGIVFILLVDDIDETKIFVRIDPLPNDLDELATRGVRAMLAIGPLPLASHQTCLRWVGELHLAKARSKWLDEVVIVSPEGAVLEAINSAIAFIKDETIYLPSADLPLLPRVSVETLISAAKRIGLQSKRLIFYPIDLYKADEVILISSEREVLPLIQLDDIPIKRGVIYQRLAMSYRDLVFEELRLRQ